MITGLVERAQDAGFSVCSNHVRGMFSLFFDIERAENFEHVAASNVELFNRFFHGMLDQGVYLAPSAFEAGFISTIHSVEIIEQTLAAAERVFATLKAS